MPEESKKPVKYDVDGYEAVTDALISILNSFPGLEEDEKIRFSTLNEDGGIAFYPVTGAVVALEKKSVTGKVDQLCNYPFYVIYRSSIDSPKIKASIKEFLDTLGKWLEQQTVVINGEQVKLEEYPVLTEERKIEEIVRLTPAHLDNVSDSNIQDWAISISLKYRNIFYKNR